MAALEVVGKECLDWNSNPFLVVVLTLSDN